MAFIKASQAYVKQAHRRGTEAKTHPAFREPVRRLLGMTGPELDTVLKEKGGAHVKKQLATIDLSRKKSSLKRSMAHRSASNLDGEVKQLKYISALQAQDLTPDQAYMISKVPVIPPMYRPVLPGRGGQELIYGAI